MKRAFFRGMLAALTATLVAGAAMAASVHFKPRTPTFTDNGTTLTTCGTLAGLGNQDVTITVAATGNATVLCISPGGNAAPGQNKIPVSPTGQVTIPATEIKNGNLSFCVTTIAPTVSAKEAGCPNDNWTVQLQDVQFSNATVTVVQGGETVLTQSFRVR